jgi:hypothetical protein
MYELINHKRTIFVPVWEWSNILQIAFNFEWNPAGTFDPRFYKNPSEQLTKEFNLKNNNWKCGYFESSLQMVGKQDAVNIGKALEKAMAELDSIGHYRSKRYSDLILACLRSLRDIETQKRFDKYVCFFKEGSFRIWYDEGTKQHLYEIDGCRIVCA